ncbi:MAG: MarR family winged helix-turn-helix transcriptional regulator [Candidatus Gastranaerophilales bacterium]|nr:MarR family winged helix-turn-helix transcriptional regulator [Candidatus Gastranaerophilales bacterium]
MEKKHCIQSLFYNVEQTARICHTGAESYLKEFAQNKLSFDEYIILEMVLCFPDVCQRDLAKLILKGSSHTSKLLAILEEKKLIERPVDKKGNRIVRKIIVTDLGVETYNFVSKILDNYIKSIENVISKQEAADCEIFLNKIKETVIKSGNIVFE